MPSIPIISGVVADETGEFVESLPINLEPIAVDSKVAKGQLRATAGTSAFGQGPGPSRGAITWGEQHYRVSGNSLVSVSNMGICTVIGAVPGTGRVKLDYSFDRLSVAADGKLFYYGGGTFTQVTDPDLGEVRDALWMDGYFITTDGKYVVVTELNDPGSVKPLKYGSAEQDPDTVTGLYRLGTELVVLGANTLEFFQNVGGNGFPFRVQKGATVRIGCVGPHAKCGYAQTMAFVGGGRGEANGVYIIAGGAPRKLSTRAVDRFIAAEPDPSSIHLESRVYGDEQRLYVHLTAMTLVYLLNASEVFQTPVWYVAQSGFNLPYRIRDAVPAYGKWICGDTKTGEIGIMNERVATHFGEKANWQFDCGQLYNDGRGALVHAVELVGLPGRGTDPDPVMFMSMTRDGRTFSVERPLSMGKPGERNKRMQWRPHAIFKTYMGLRFRGMNSNLPGFSACNIEAEPLGL